MRNLIDSPTVPATLAAIDDANAQDPNGLRGGPLALVQGERASRWLSRLSESPSAELQLCVRAHHLRRWEIARAGYPMGRQGYLRWRRANKAHQGESLASIMQEAGWSAESIDVCRTLLLRTKLRSDPDTQLLEDAACLVFLETQFEAMVDSTDHDHLVAIVAKTLRKMSSDAIALAQTIPLSERTAAVLQDAVANNAESTDTARS